jgi:hypothetical protein
MTGLSDSSTSVAKACIRTYTTLNARSRDVDSRSVGVELTHNPFHVDHNLASGGGEEGQLIVSNAERVTVLALGPGHAQRPCA